MGFVVTIGGIFVYLIIVGVVSIFISEKKKREFVEKVNKF